MVKIREVYLLFYVIMMAGIAAGCDKAEKDGEYPIVVVKAPSVGSVFENGDTIRFQAMCSDDLQLANIELLLVDEDNKPMLPTISVVPGKKQYTFQGDYIINDPLLPGGVYQLRFRASDGANVTNRFVEIQIQELAQKLLYPVIVTHPETGTWNAYRQMPNNVWKEICVQTGDYCGSAVNPAASQFYMCGVFQSGLMAMHLPEGDVLWTVKPGIHQSQRWFEGISFDFPQLYVSCAEGNLRGYDKMGKEIYKSETFPNAVPYLSVTTTNYITGAFKDAFSNNRFLVIFHNQGGLMIYNKFMESEIAALLPVKGDKVLVLSNGNGQGEISLYNGADNTLVPMHSFYEGPFHEAVALDTDNFLISASSGLYWYRLSNNSLTMFVSGIVNSTIACDPTEQLIYACTGKKMEIYAFPYATLLESYALPDTAIDLHLVFNR